MTNKDLRFPVRIGDQVRSCPLADDGTITVAFDCRDGSFSGRFNLIDVLAGEIGSRAQAEKALADWIERRGNE